MINYLKLPLLIYTFALLLCRQVCFSAAGTDPSIINNPKSKTITIAVPDKTLVIVIDYATGCAIKQLNIKGKNVLSPAGVFTGIRTKGGVFSADKSLGKVTVAAHGDEVIVSGISYGNEEITVEEKWYFKVAGQTILWRIEREYSQDAELEDMAFPGWHFADLSVWKGGILDNGGMVWCKYLKQAGDTYGVHTGGVTFWNAVSGDALRISIRSDSNKTVASKYTHDNNKAFVSTQLVTDRPLKQRYQLSRFVSGKEDVFAPFKVRKGRTTVTCKLQYADYFKTYSRGTLPGIDVDAVRELLNTTGRYGVVDNNIIGGNGWLTNWKCLHEPFFAQIGMALNDEGYTKNFSATLDQERDQAMLADGRVLSRWHNAAGDEIPGTYNPETGYYEAMWGYTIDSQTGYVINTSEQFDLNGDLTWLRSHQASCEKALNWLIKRDENHNGIFEMLNNNISEKKCSDWLDIVWAGYENAFVNAQLYEALTLWANCEKVLGNPQQAAYYSATALRLKTSFNKPLEAGGFWSQEKNQYVYWRDKDGSVHGDNLVTPVNFAAIAFGLCDDPQRIARILDQIEQRTTAEHLFHWPLCFDSFKQGEVSGGNWPFPKYENGDIFPTWGYLGIRAYANYDKAIALKFIDNILQQYKKDGLSSQRYSRTTQEGLGDDILAGICTSITALYRDIYGVRPKWNRMGIEPNMMPALNGTSFSYTLRDTVYQLKLSVDDYSMSTMGFSVKSKNAFGANKTGNIFTYYPNNEDSVTLVLHAGSGRPVSITMEKWETGELSWTINSKDSYECTVKGLRAGAVYQVGINNIFRTVKATGNGSLAMKQLCKSATRFIVREHI
ncbi:alpha-L-rhamnosidase-related protein [Chitinophaga sp. RAB17]|uniref:alpha-L-rhamnosidase-related protein n=1 Tax=Chitinophaga sp. RAB17 TaxID=3233049 RepID=UPI003F921B7E